MTTFQAIIPIGLFVPIGRVQKVFLFSSVLRWQHAYDVEGERELFWRVPSAIFLLNVANIFTRYFTHNKSLWLVI